MTDNIPEDIYNLIISFYIADKFSTFITKINEDLVDFLINQPKIRIDDGDDENIFLNKQFSQIVFCEKKKAR
jgi:hypothetical protein